jgi:PAS domain-containing protein
LAVAGPSHPRQRPIELILLRELARRLAMPVTLYDADQRLVYLNPAAEALLAAGREKLEETSLDDMMDFLRPTDAYGAPIPAERMPIGVALTEERGQHGNLWIHDAQGVAHWMANTSIPLRGQGGDALGAMSIWWKVGDGLSAPR